MSKHPTPITLAGICAEVEQSATPKRARMSVQDRQAANTDFHHHSLANNKYTLDELAPDDSFTITKFRPHHSKVYCVYMCV